VNKDLRIALKAGLTSYLLSSIVVAILLSPYWAGLHAYGHSHKDNSKHFHSLNFFIQIDVVAEVFSIISTQDAIETVTPIAAISTKKAITRLLRTRAPPKSYSLWKKENTKI